MLVSTKAILSPRRRRATGIKGDDFGLLSIAYTGFVKRCGSAGTRGYCGCVGCGQGWGGLDLPDRVDRATSRRTHLSLGLFYSLAGGLCGPIGGISILRGCRPPVGTADPFDVVGYPELPSGADTTLTGGRAATGTGEGSDILSVDQTNELILWHGGRAIVVAVLVSLGVLVGGSLHVEPSSHRHLSIWKLAV